MTTRETMLEIIERRRDEVFLVDASTGRELTYRDFHRQACALAAELESRGLRHGDRIAVTLPNCCELAVLYFACMYLGAVIVPINPASSKSDVQFILASSKPKMMVAGGAAIELLKDAQPTPIQLVTTQDIVGRPECGNIIEVGALAAADDFLLMKRAAGDDLIVIMFTSGTSARPKGLAHYRDRMFRNAQAFASAQGIDQNSRFYLTLSMAYMGGFYNLLVLPFLCGASVVVDHVFDARSSLSFWEKARRNNVNTLWMAPTVLSILLRMDRGSSGEQFCRDCVRHAFVGFAPLPLKVKDEFEARYGVSLIENYGLSETLFVTARSQASGSGQGYVGEALPGVRLRIVNDDGGVAGDDADGEVQILTPDLMAGYLDAAGDLQLVNRDEWFSTGDMGRLEPGPSLCITGRKKDVIIRGGVNISPAAIEEALMQVAGVGEAAVVSVPHELYGEDIVAVLKLDAGVDLDSILDSVIQRAKNELASHQQPARYIAIDEFPRTANGKIQKSRIRELVAQKLQINAVNTQRRPAPAIAGAGR